SLEVLLVASSDGVARAAEHAMLEEIDRLAALLSGYVPTSEVGRWQRTLDCDAVVSEELAEVLARAESWRIRTSGAFNVAAEAIKEALAAGGDVDAIVS